MFVGIGIVKTNILPQRKQKLISCNEVQSLPYFMNSLQTLNSRVFRKHIETLQNQLNRVNTYNSKFDQLLKLKFSEGSMSYAKFKGIMEQATDAIIKASLLFVSRVQLFDESGYIDIKHLIETGAYHKDSIDDSVQNYKYDVYLDNYYSITNMLTTNEEILIKLEQLSMEISSMDANSLDNENTQLIDDINTLIAETQYYE